MTYTDEKRKKMADMVNKIVARGKDPLQAQIDDQKELTNKLNLSRSKYDLSEVCSDREER